MVALVGLSIRILIVCPTREAGRTLFIHESAGVEVSTGVGVNEIASGFGVNVGPKVGMGGKLAVAVGRSNVAVGMAAWVSTKFVTAAAIDVLCRSVRLTAGVACGAAPQALMISVITSAWVRIEKRFMWTSPNYFTLARIIQVDPSPLRE